MRPALSCGRVSSEASVLASLANGATGIWCGVSREGAAVGHCCSAVTLANLHRLGNEHVARTYNLPAVRAAAVEVTRITTGRDPPDHEEVYGARAMDVVFDDDDGGMGGATQQRKVAEAMGATVRNRVTTFTSPRMFQERLLETYSASCGLRRQPSPILRRVPSDFGAEWKARRSSLTRRDSESGSSWTTSAATSQTVSDDAPRRLPQSHSAADVLTHSARGGHGSTDTVPAGALARATAKPSPLRRTATLSRLKVKRGASFASPNYQASPALTVATDADVPVWLDSPVGYRVRSQKTAARMHELMMADLIEGRKLEYDTDVGLLHLFERAGGRVEAPMVRRASMQVKVRCAGVGRDDPSGAKGSADQVLEDHPVIVQVPCDDCLLWALLTP
jgi:hypothetical protein